MAERTLSQLCEIIAASGLTARIDGPDKSVCAVNTLEDAKPGEISFVSNPKYRHAVRDTRASAVILGEELSIPDSLSAIRCNDPYAAVTVAIITLHGHRVHPRWGVSDRATIDSSAAMGANPNIAAGVAIAADVSIGKNCTIYPGCYLGDGVTLGDDVTLYPNVVVYDGCALGNRVVIHAGSVVGEDGLGYAPRNDKWVKIPQVGRVVIGDDVEIGANCTIDRATLGQTEIGAGTKFGNLIVVGHGTKIGPDCMFVALIGLAGSVTVERHVTLGGQVGVAGHLTIGQNTRIGGKSGIYADVPADATLIGAPAIPAAEGKRSMIAVNKLPAWVRRVRELEREVRELRRLVDSNGRR